MTPWQISWPEWSRVTGWNVMREPLDNYVNWYWDCAAYSFLNLWFMPYRMPGIHSDVDKFVSQFSLNGIKSFNICRPN
jgi:hypothetical protein